MATLVDRIAAGIPAPPVRRLAAEFVRAEPWPNCWSSGTGRRRFGADDYDQLSDLGHAPVRTGGAGAARRGLGARPAGHRHAEAAKGNLASMGFDAAPEDHAGFNEYDFHDLLARPVWRDRCRIRLRHDRKTHFRTLRETIFDWQDGGIAGAHETWADFADRVDAARHFATETDAQTGAGRISSGGAIGQLVSRSSWAHRPHR